MRYTYFLQRTLAQSECRGGPRICRQSRAGARPAYLSNAFRHRTQPLWTALILYVVFAGWCGLSYRIRSRQCRQREVLLVTEAKRSPDNPRSCLSDLRFPVSCAIAHMDAFTSTLSKVEFRPQCSRIFSCHVSLLLVAAALASPACWNLSPNVPSSHAIKISVQRCLLCCT